VSIANGNKFEPTLLFTEAPPVNVGVVDSKPWVEEKTVNYPSFVMSNSHHDNPTAKS
jgi:hypothetical protein